MAVCKVKATECGKHVHWECDYKAHKGEILKSGNFWYVSTVDDNSTEPGADGSSYSGGLTYSKAILAAAKLA